MELRNRQALSSYVVLAAALSCFLAMSPPAFAQKQIKIDPSKLPPEPRLPKRYVLDYPPVSRFCQPIRTAFVDAATTERIVGGRRIHQHPNGGYGMALMQVQGVDMFHTGSDIGWFRVNEPVFAIADGVVRMSTHPARKTLGAMGVKLPTNRPIDFGNMVVIEHRTNDNEYFVSLYAHLGDDRMVKTGDIVTAGQQIGTIGRKSYIVNGGYDPHLHFAIHEGRMVDRGIDVLGVPFQGEVLTFKLVDMQERRVQLQPSKELGGSMKLGFGDPMNPNFLDITKEGDRFYAPSWLLYQARNPGMAMAGYVPQMIGWKNPTQFLLDNRADRDPAPYMFCSPMRPLHTPPGPHPETWDVEEWLNLGDADAPTKESLQGKYTVVFTIQLDCQASLSHGFQAIKEVQNAYAGADNFQVLVFHIPRGSRTPTNVNKLKEAVSAAGVTVPVAHMPKPSNEFLASMGVLGTPSVTFFDTKGQGRYASYVFRPDWIVRRLNSVRDEDVELGMQGGGQ